MVASSAQGLFWLTRALDSLQYEEISLEQVYQPHMHHPCTKPADYDAFWLLYEQQGYLSVQKYLGNNTTKGKFLASIARVLYKLRLIETLKRIKIWIGKR